MTLEELNKILDDHEKWLNSLDDHEKWLNSNDGKRADLSRTDLSEADLSGADLRLADLRWANLSGANLSRTDLRGANLDFSCWPLWCGSFDVKVGRRIAAQLAYHFCLLDCDDPEYLEARKAITAFANKFHRVEECGLRKVEND